MEIKLSNIDHEYCIDYEGLGTAGKSLEELIECHFCYLSLILKATSCNEFCTIAH